MKIEQEDFERFIRWLKNEGVNIKVNERWWRRRIFERLLNDHPMTLQNWQDYQDSRFNDNSLDNALINYSCDPLLLIGVTLKFHNGTVKKIERVIDTNSYIHLFFDDRTDEIISRELCHEILKSKY